MGRREGDDAWDSYETVAGESLVHVGRQPRAWWIVRGWLQTLADEIVAARDDGTSVPLAVTHDRLTDTTLVVR